MATFANVAGAILTIVYLIVFGFGTACLIVGFGGSLWRAVSERERYWERLRAAILIASGFFAVTYGLVVLFWLNRAGFPEVVAYAAACALAYFVVRRIKSAQAPRSASALGTAGAVAAACVAAYSWGLYAGVSRGWSESGYFVAYGKCDSSFDHCIESGAYATLADCQRELVSVNASGEDYTCIELREVPRVYLPWTK